LNFALRRENLLGTNQFPNFSEQLTKEIDNLVFKPVDLTASDAEVETLKPYRGAQSFEALRYATDVYSKAVKRPVVFMLTIGNLAMRKARAQFSCNFFAVAGFEVIDNNGFASAEEGVAAAKAANADIVVVCSSDEEYAEIAPAVAKLLNNEILVVAGAPECRPQLEEQGIKNYISMKSNILQELKAYQSLLGI
jgi:methylmalonyl-CoA mutase